MCRRATACAPSSATLLAAGKGLEVAALGGGELFHVRQARDAEVCQHLHHIRVRTVALTRHGLAPVRVAKIVPFANSALKLGAAREACKAGSGGGAGSRDHIGVAGAAFPPDAAAAWSEAQPERAGRLVGAVERAVERRHGRSEIRGVVPRPGAQRVEPDPDQAMRPERAGAAGVPIAAASSIHAMECGRPDSSASARKGSVFASSSSRSTPRRCGCKASTRRISTSNRRSRDDSPSVPGTVPSSTCRSVRGGAARAGRAASGSAGANRPAARRSARTHGAWSGRASHASPPPARARPRAGYRSPSRCRSCSGVWRCGPGSGRGWKRLGGRTRAARFNALDNSRLGYPPARASGRLRPRSRATSARARPPAPSARRAPAPWCPWGW